MYDYNEFKDVNDWVVQSVRKNVHNCPIYRIEKFDISPNNIALDTVLLTRKNTNSTCTLNINTLLNEVANRKIGISNGSVLRHWRGWHHKDQRIKDELSLITEEYINNLILRQKLTGTNLGVVKNEKLGVYKYIYNKYLVVVYIPKDIVSNIDLSYFIRSHHLYSYKILKVVGTAGEIGTKLFSELRIKLLDLSDFDMSSLQKADSMFAGAVIDKIIFSKTNLLNNCNHMFARTCINNLDLTMFNTRHIKNYSAMFYKAQIQNLNISNWDILSESDISYMFCKASIMNLKGINNLKSAIKRTRKTDENTVLEYAEINGKSPNICH